MESVSTDREFDELTATASDDLNDVHSLLSVPESRSYAGTEMLEKMDELTTLVRNLTRNVSSIEGRLTRLEMTGRISEANVESSRSERFVETPRNYAAKYTESPQLVGLGASRSSSVVSGSSSVVGPSLDNRLTHMRSRVSRAPPTPRDSLTPILPSEQSMMINPKSSASSKGYNTKMSLWATALASLMASIMESYMVNTGQTSHVVDPVAMMKSYTSIVADLYSKAKSCDLPAVQSSAAVYLASCFKRVNTSEVLATNPTSWTDMMDSVEGRQCVAVLESMLLAAKLVPEAMLHPASQIIQRINVPFVIKVPATGRSIYTIPTTTEVTYSPTSWENLCRIFKAAAYKKYVSFRLNGSNEMESLIRLTSITTDSDLFDQKNMVRGRSMLRERHIEIRDRG